MRALCAGVLFCAALLFYSVPPSFADEENCIMCHRFPGLARVDEGNKLRLLFINEALVKEGPHNRVKCSDCHAGVDRIPHEKQLKEVDCVKECHIQEPSTGKMFSHRHIQDMIALSVHSRTGKDGNPKEHAKDLPNCRNCHRDDPVYRPMSYFKIAHQGMTDRSLERCVSCHEKKEFAESFYKHVSSRLRRSRSATEVIDMCGSCHEDREIIKRHKLKNVVYTYSETFHGKSAIFGGKRQPDCTDCHIKPGESVHMIRTHEDPLSSINKKNAPKTCNQTACHETAGPNLAAFKVHLDTHTPEAVVERYTYYFFILLTAGVLIMLFLIMFMEQLRSFFPDVGLLKERGKKHD